MATKTGISKYVVHYTRNWLVKNNSGTEFNFTEKCVFSKLFVEAKKSHFLRLQQMNLRKWVFFLLPRTVKQI